MSSINTNTDYWLTTVATGDRCILLERIMSKYIVYKEHGSRLCVLAGVPMIYAYSKIPRLTIRVEDWRLENTRYLVDIPTWNGRRVLQPCRKKRGEWRVLFSPGTWHRSCCSLYSIVHSGILKIWTWIPMHVARRSHSYWAIRSWRSLLFLSPICQVANAVRPSEQQTRLKMRCGQ